MCENHFVLRMETHAKLIIQTNKYNHRCNNMYALRLNIHWNKIMTSQPTNHVLRSQYIEKYRCLRSLFEICRNRFLKKKKIEYVENLREKNAAIQSLLATLQH